MDMQMMFAGHFRNGQYYLVYDNDGYIDPKAFQPVLIK